VGVFGRRALRRSDPDSLIASLGSADAREREEAANALIGESDQRAEEPLLEALRR
jgi:hypothetical protein